MKHRPLFLFALLFLSFFCPLRAQTLDLPDIPDSLPEEDRAPLLDKRDHIQKEWDAFLADKAAFVSEYAGTEEGTPRAAEAERRKAELKTQADGIVDEADAFTERVGLVLRAHELDEQIAETQKQLQGLGFKRAVPDFAWFAGQSGRARQHLIEQLVGRARDYAIAQTQASFQESFLERIRTMSEHDANRLAEVFVKLHLRNHEFQQWLRAFSPKASRAVLVNGAKMALDAIKTEERLFKIADDMDQATVESQQDAALTLVSMFVDYPGLKELKAVATGAYDVGEAWATIVILDRGIDELTNATEIQLANQKKIILHLKDLMEKRNELRAQIAQLPPL